MLITGAGTGIGLKAAKLLDQAGNTVIMVARDGERLAREGAALAHAHPYACDIADPEQVDGLVAYVRQEHQALDVLFLNAGVTHGYQLFSDQDPVPWATAEAEVNYLSAVRLTHLFEPLLRDKPDPAMIITTSGVALVRDVGNPTYSATKAALHSLCLTMRFVLERTRSPIRVFEVMAPMVDTPLPSMSGPTRRFHRARSPRPYSTVSRQTTWRCTWADRADVFGLPTIPPEALRLVNAATALELARGDRPHLPLGSVSYIVTAIMAVDRHTGVARGDLSNDESVVLAFLLLGEPFVADNGVVTVR